MSLPAVGALDRLPKSEPPPGFKIVLRQAKARPYRVFVSDMGVVFPSLKRAWASFRTRPAASSAAVGVDPALGPGRLTHRPPGLMAGVASLDVGGAPSSSSTPDRMVQVSPSTLLLSLVLSCGLEPGVLPDGIFTVSQAAVSVACPEHLRVAARAYVALGLAGADAPARRLPALSPAKLSSEQSLAAQEVLKLRRILPEGCERRMLGSEHDFNQATPEMRRTALARKFAAASGPSGGSASRDRRFVQRWLTFCRSRGVSPPWPVGAVVFSEFIADATSKSKGSKKGASVAHSLKLAAVHARDHFCLPVSLDAAVLFNLVQPHRGDSDAAASPSLACLACWERLAASHPSPAARHACQIAVLACWLSLRSVHFIRLTVLESSNDDDVRLNVARDKDSSTNIWVGCDAYGLSGRFVWWPDLMERAISRGFVACVVSFSDLDGTDGFSTASLSDSPATSSSMERLFALAFAAAGASLADQRRFRLTGHSPRHLLPSVAEVFMWHALLRDELGRWATGAANAKKVKCGPRYTSMANRSLQIFLRRSLRELMTMVAPLLPPSEGCESLVPDFEAMSRLSAVTSSACFGPHGPGYIPGFSRVAW